MTLRREIGVFGAIMMGLGSIIGTGVFVSIGIAAGIAGASVILAIAMAALVATCNALSSAQLAANHPVSGGTYEYGYRYLNPWLGFSAGWMFLCAKTASAATAALGFSGYLINAFDLAPQQQGMWLIIVAVTAASLLTIVVLCGIRRSNHLNMAIVTVTLVSLAAFVVAGIPAVSPARLTMTWEPISLLHAAALMFVAYSGYARITTFGEEIIDPRRNIPRAIITTLILSMIVYLAVAVVGVGAVGAEQLNAATQTQAAPLALAAQAFPVDVHRFVALGAMTAMLGVLLNLILGLSRVLLAMGRRGDMPACAANVHVAVVLTGLAIAGLAATGNVKTTWSFSAFTVLVYYALTNLAALRLADQERLFSRWWARCGLSACLALAFSIEWQVWAAGLAILALGLLWHTFRRKTQNGNPPRQQGSSGVGL